MMKHVFKLILSFILISTVSNAQQINMAWDYTHTQNGEESRLITTDFDNNIFIVGERGTLTKLDRMGDTLFTIAEPNVNYDAVKLMIDSDNNLLSLGMISLNGDDVIRIQKMDLMGNLIWEFGLDTASGSRDKAESMELDANNDIYITGFKGDQHFGVFYTAKISKNGSLIWDANYVGPYGPKQHTGMSLAIQDPNTIYAIGYEYINGTNSNALLIKYDGQGILQWAKSFSYKTWQNEWYETTDWGKKVSLDAAGNIYTLNYNYSGSRSVIIKYDASGNDLWTVEVDPTRRSLYEELIVDANSLYVGGSTEPIGNSGMQFSVAKLDLSGTILWDTISNYTIAEGKYMTKYKDGVVLTGNSNVCNGCDDDFITMAFDQNGATKWVHELSTAHDAMADHPYGLAIDNDGAIIITGHGFGSMHSGYTFKLFDCEEFVPEIDRSNDTLMVKAEGSNYQWINCDSNMVIAGENSRYYVPSTPGNYAVEVTMFGCFDTAACFNYTAVGLQQLTLNEKVSIYPNPVQNRFTVEIEDWKASKLNLSLISITGQEMIKKQVSTINGSKKIEFNTSSLSRGVYLMKISDGDHVMIEKLILN